MSKHTFSVPTGRMEVHYDDSQGLMTWMYRGRGTPKFPKPFRYDFKLDEVNTFSRNMAASRTIFEVAEHIKEVGKVPDSLNTEIYDEILGNRPNDRTLDHDDMASLWGVVGFSNAPCPSYAVKRYDIGHAQRQGHPDDYFMPQTWYPTREQAQAELASTKVLCPWCTYHVDREAIEEKVPGFPACVGCNMNLTAVGGHDTDDYNKDTGFRKYEPLTVAPNEWLTRLEFAKTYGPAIKDKMMNLATALADLGYHGKVTSRYGAFELRAKDQNKREIILSTEYRLSHEGGGRVKVSASICTHMPDPNPNTWKSVSAYGANVSPAFVIRGNGLEPTREIAESFVEAFQSIDTAEIRAVADELNRNYDAIHK